MRNLLLLGAAAATAALAFAAVGAARPSATVIHVVEHATTDAITNPDDGTDSAGAILTFTNPVFDEGDSSQVGSDQGYCIRLVVSKSWECNWTTFLPKGQLTVEGPFYDTQDSVLAITGGTGRYSLARGSMELKSRNGGTEYDFIFRVEVG